MSLLFFFSINSVSCFMVVFDSSLVSDSFLSLCVFPSLWLSAGPWCARPRLIIPTILVYIVCVLPVFCVSSSSSHSKHSWISPSDSPPSVFWPCLLSLCWITLFCLLCWLTSCVPNLSSVKGFCILNWTVMKHALESWSSVSDFVKLNKNWRDQHKHKSGC